MSTKLHKLLDDLINLRREGVVTHRMAKAAGLHKEILANE